jgi:hypothetical protein
MFPAAVWSTWAERKRSLLPEASRAVRCRCCVDEGGAASCLLSVRRADGCTKAAGRYSFAAGRIAGKA